MIACVRSFKERGARLIGLETIAHGAGLGMGHPAGVARARLPTWEAALRMKQGRRTDYDAGPIYFCDEGR
ncbi:MAG: hypothetical protein ACYDAL_06935 [Candidatus Dormibacteraceae bacterium]